jgi:hypothetical protein
MKDYLGPNEIPLVDPEFTREDQWNNAICKYGVRNAHIWFGVEDLNEMQITCNVLLERSGFTVEDVEG